MQSFNIIKYSVVFVFAKNRGSFYSTDVQIATMEKKTLPTYLHKPLTALTKERKSEKKTNSLLIHHFKSK